jgi:hypothetical protein
MTELDLNFMHPQYGTLFQASVPTDYRVAEVLELLQSVGFLTKVQSPNRYALAFYDQVLSMDSPLGQISELADGDILKVVFEAAAAAPLEEQAAPSLLPCWLALPQGGLIPWEIEPTQPLSQILTELQHKGFIAESPDQLTAWLRGHEPWPLEANAQTQGLMAKDLIQIRLLESPQGPALSDLQQALADLQGQLGRMQAHLNEELTVIRHKIPLPYTIPLDAEMAALNPTQFPYRSLDSLLAQARQTAKLPPFVKIQAQNWQAWLWLSLVLLAALSLLVFLFLS